MVVSPPFLYIEQVKSSLTDRIEISAQNCWVGKGGAYTGEIRFLSSLLDTFVFQYSSLYVSIFSLPSFFVMGDFYSGKLHNPTRGTELL